MIARLFIALPLTFIGLGIGVTVLWLADGFWRLIRHFRRAEG